MTRDQSCGFPLRARKYRRSASVTTSDFFRISFRQTSSSAFSMSEGTVTEMALYLAEAFIGDPIIISNHIGYYCRVQVECAEVAVLALNGQSVAQARAIVTREAEHPSVWTLRHSQTARSCYCVMSCDKSLFLVWVPKDKGRRREPTKRCQAIPRTTRFLPVPH